MKEDLGALKVEKVIVHDIPIRLVHGDGQSPILSEVESPLTQELKNYFREKISGTLVTAGYDVLFDPSSPSPVPNIVLNMLCSKVIDFVAISRQIAQLLYDSQTGVNSPGLLCVAQGAVRTERTLGILKLEREAGVRLQQTHLHGKTTFNLEHIRELMLTVKTKVFKVGLFIQKGKSLNTIEGVVSDNQRGYNPNTEVANFFLKRFLGCMLREAPEVTTKRLFETTARFISEQVSEPEIKARYTIALLSELSSESKTFGPKRFAEKHLRLEDRQQYIDWLDQSNIAPQPFDKNIVLIKNHLRRIQLDFESGIAVFGNPEVFEQNVIMKDLSNGKTHVEIEDRIRRIQGK